MKAVMISIQPQWVKKILRGEKTIEIRKTAPKLQPPFKCYIYCTQNNGRERHLLTYAQYCGFDMETYEHDFIANKKVVAEFICDRIFPIRVFNNGSIQDWNFNELEKSCVPYDRIATYIGANRSGYGWHISDLKVYDTPKVLSEYTPICRYMEDDMQSCNYRNIACNYQVFDHNPWPDCSVNAVTCKRRMKRPPQSWCYVEELK